MVGRSLPFTPHAMGNILRYPFAVGSSVESAVANPALLAVAREAAGLTQAELASALSRLAGEGSMPLL
jgi:hypothetical protein